MKRESTLTVRHQEQKLFSRVKHARSFVARLRGLLFSKPLDAQDGLLLTPCNQVHTLGMRFPIDVVFLDSHGRIIRCVNKLKPNRAAFARGARHTLEVRAGSIENIGLQPGQVLHWISTAGHGEII